MTGNSPAARYNLLVIKNPIGWVTAIARFRGFHAYLPQWPHERHVAEYHSILHDFELASDDNFSPFKIPESDLHLDKYAPAISFYEPPIPGYKYCDPVIFKGRVVGLLQFIVSLTEASRPKTPPQSPPKKQPGPPPSGSSIYIHSMTDSQLISGSANASIKNTFTANSNEFRDLVGTMSRRARCIVPLRMRQDGDIKSPLHFGGKQSQKPHPF